MLTQIKSTLQVQACAMMVKFDFTTDKILIREKEEWRCASMECGGQCVQMDGMKLLLMLSALSLDTALEITVGLVIYHQLHALIFITLCQRYFTGKLSTSLQ